MISLSPRQSRGNIAAARVLLRSASAGEPPKIALGPRHGRARHAGLDPAQGRRGFCAGAKANRSGRRTINPVCEPVHIGRRRRVSCLGVPNDLEGVMESRTQVAHYAATMTRELCRMCRKVELDDLAYLLEVAAAEAARVRATNGSTQTDIHSLHAQTG